MRMTDASEAGKALAKARWGTRRLDRLIGELAERRDEFGAVQRSQLRAMLDEPEYRDGSIKQHATGHAAT